MTISKTVLTDEELGFMLGYGGWCNIGLGEIQTEADTLVPLLSGGVSRLNSVPMQTSYSLPFDVTPRSPIRLAKGTYSFSGSITFELTDSLSDIFFSADKGGYDSIGTFFQRSSFLNIVMCDGEGTINLKGCVWNSFDLTVAPGGTISCTLSFLTLNGYNEDIIVNDTISGAITDTSTMELEKYWQYGAHGIQDFSLSFSRQVTPVYLNNTLKTPTYLKVGVLDIDLKVTCWENWFLHPIIQLGKTKTLELHGDFQSEKSYNIAGINDLGTKTYTNKATNTSISSVFTISGVNNK